MSPHLETRSINEIFNHAELDCLRFVSSSPYKNILHNQESFSLNDFEMKTKKKNKKEQEFIKNFVNAVYGILLGYGFSSAIREIYRGPDKDSQNDFLYNSFINSYLEYSMVIFAIIVLCVHWWDWRIGVSKYVSSKISEFIINILILLNIEWLFFEYDSLNNSFLLMATLASLNLLWVINFRLQSFNKSNLPFVNYISQDFVIGHILKRFYGAILYFGLFIVYLYTPETVIKEPTWLFFLFALFLIDRFLFYRVRKIRIGSKVRDL